MKPLYNSHNILKIHDFIFNQVYRITEFNPETGFDFLDEIHNYGPNGANNMLDYDFLIDEYMLDYDFLIDEYFSKNETII